MSNLPTRPRLRLLALALAVVVAVATGCLPSAPSTGRATPVRKVLVLGDSMSHGLFGTSPSIRGQLESRFGASGISVQLIGGPGSNPIAPWPGLEAWDTQLQRSIDSFDPDVVIIQSVLFPQRGEADAEARYRTATTRLFDIAQSRGAHTYVVAHNAPTNRSEFLAALDAERYQSEIAAPRGISVIPSAWWIERCNKPFLFDGFHLSANGGGCLADAMNAAVNQLRNEVG